MTFTCNENGHAGERHFHMNGFAQTLFDTEVKDNLKNGLYAN